MKIGGSSKQQRNAKAALEELGAQQVYEALGAELADLDFGARLDLANALNDGTSWEDLSDEQREVFRSVWRAIP